MTGHVDELLEGVFRGDSRALRELLMLLRPHCVAKLFERHDRFSDDADIVDDVESLLFEWSIGPDARERLPAGDTLGKLASRLLSQVVRQRKRNEARHWRIASELAQSPEAGQAPVHEAGIGVLAIVTVLMALAGSHRETLLAHVRFRFGQGPPLTQALGVSDEAAKRRLSRAREALVRGLLDEGLIDSEEEFRDRQT